MLIYVWFVETGVAVTMVSISNLKDQKSINNCCIDCCMIADKWLVETGVAVPIVSHLKDQYSIIIV